MFFLVFASVEDVTRRLGKAGFMALAPDGLSSLGYIAFQQHCGTIAVDSSPGEFTDFVIQLPHAAARVGTAAIDQHRRI